MTNESSTANPIALWRDHPRWISAAQSDPARLVDLACLDLMRRKRAGQNVGAKDYIRVFPVLGDSPGLLDLIDADLCVSDELKLPSPADHYIDAFPSLKSEINDLMRLAQSAKLASIEEQPKRGRVKNEPDEAMPDKLGGYRIVRLLGEGAMGTVYEAKQISLDRLVALKTVRGRLANNPAALARFTREAYAAAQLNHHNVVQIYDFGEDAGRHFFSMEWVRGGPLDRLVKQKGKLNPKRAAGYVLQAARGLAAAHKNGMVHRDIKPANLLLNHEGVIKVADLGLVKIPDFAEPEIHVGSSKARTTAGARTSDSSPRDSQVTTDVTMEGSAIGTPAYMAPEQGLDATRVDHRADIYSLGCTLFYLLAGRVPFGGSVVSEVLEQHTNQAPPSLREINPRIPPSLEAIVYRAMAKRADERYATLDDMCADLQRCLGISNTGPFKPTAKQADLLEAIAARHASAASMDRLADNAWIGLVAFSILITFGCLTIGWPWILLGPSMGIAAMAAALMLAGDVGPLGVQVRRWIGSFGWIDHLTVALGFVAFVILAIVSGLWIGVLMGALIGIGLGVVYHFAVTRSIQTALAGPLMEARKFVRDFRLAGAEENSLRLFVARYSGNRWQRLFERLFGYEALITMRKQLALDPSFDRNSVAPSVRDRICAMLAKRVARSKRASDHSRLAAIEQQGLQSEGLSNAEAKARAWQMAAAVIEASKIAEAPTGHVSSAEARAAADAKREAMKAMLADARSGKYKVAADELETIRFLLGGQTRFLIGALLLALFALWGDANGLFESFKDLESLKKIGSGEADLSGLRDAAATANSDSEKRPVLGGATPWSVGLAGLLLVLSAMVGGGKDAWKVTPFAALATLAILFGPILGVPGIGEWCQPWVTSVAVGMAIYLPGIILAERADT